MIKVGDLISKKLIILNSAYSAGTVKNVVFDAKLTAAKLLEIYDDKGEDAEIRYAAFGKIKSLGADACVIADKSHLLSESATLGKTPNNPINKECFNQDGKSLGFVKDVILDGAFVSSIIADNFEFPPENIVSYSDRLVIVNDSGKPVKLYKPKKTRVPSPNNAAGRKVTLHNVSLTQVSPIQGSSTVSPTAAQTDAVKLPARVPPENTLVTHTPASEETAPNAYKFLIGKTLAKDIALDNGVVILRKHSVINDQIISSARDHGKLVQLALHAE